MLFDTDVLIWFLRGNVKALEWIDQADSRSLSVVSYMELLQGAHDRREAKIIGNFLKSYGFQVLPLTENIGHRALIYVEQYSLQVELGAVDAIIAATAVENDLTLATCNRKHFSVVRELDLKVLRP